MNDGVKHTRSERWKNYVINAEAYQIDAPDREQNLRWSCSFFIIDAAQGTSSASDMLPLCFPTPDSALELAVMTARRLIDSGEYNF